MPLSLGQIEVKAIVDWNIEWRNDGTKDAPRLREYPRNPIRRGMIVRVEGDPAMEMVDGIWITFGDDLGKDKFQVGDVTVPCIKVQPRELNLAYDAHSKVSAEAWKRTFNIPDQVGTIYQSKTAKGMKPKILDKLQLTGLPSQGPVSDGPSSTKDEE